MEEQTRDARIVALALAVGYLPQALIGLFSGAIVDRFPKKNILILTNSIATLIAACLAIGVHNGFATPTYVITLVFFAGFLNAISFPTWQSILSEIVPKDKASSALTLMFAQWNLGRIVGPAIAALLLAGNHYTIALSINALSFLVVILMMALLKEKDFKNKHPLTTAHETFGKTFLDGWKYVFSKTSGMRPSFFVYSMVLIWASPFISLIPNVADEVFHYKNLGTSLFTTFQGVGAVLISVIMTTLHVKYGSTRTQQVLVFCIPFVLIGYGLSPNLFVATPFTFLFGFTYVGALTSTTVAAQLAVAPAMKGRIAAALMSAMGLLFPVSSLIQGFFAEHFGTSTLFVCTGIGLAISSLLIGVFKPSYSLPKRYDDRPEPIVAGEAF